MDPIELEFSKLESYQEFIRNSENVGKRGVYVWGFCFVDSNTAKVTEFKPYYVGRHESNIHRKIQEHVKNVREGTHKIINKNVLIKKAEYRKVKPSDIVYDHDDLRKYYNVKEYPKSALNPSVRIQLIPHIDCYLDNLYITYLHVNHLNLQDTEKSFIHQLETFVQEKIGQNRIVSRSKDKFDDDFPVVLKPNHGTKHLFLLNG